MHPANDSERLQESRRLMLRFADRTRIGEAAETRYLWTDAFAVLNYLALAIIYKELRYEMLARQLIDDVHRVLGRYAAADPRSGWISGLSNPKAEKHPTIAGLRIGKRQPERRADEPYDQRGEWDRDGQYYHYHTRWITALLRAGQHFGEVKYYTWAAELSLAGAHFISETGGRVRMYWKMSIDLSRPLVPMMGAHDPLEGLLCALQCRALAPDHKNDFAGYIRNLRRLCRAADWTTDDALGLGGLLLNVPRAADLQNKMDLPQCVDPEEILSDVEQGLGAFMQDFKIHQPASYRLAFRECGLSLGLRTLMGCRAFLQEQGLEPVLGAGAERLPSQIEDFWMTDNNREAITFSEHLDINEVSLAASLLAAVEPTIYGRL